MSNPKLLALDRPELTALSISQRLRSQLVYFAREPAASAVPRPGENEYYFDGDDVARILDDGAIRLVSPLDTANTTEVELSEEQEALLEWLKTNAVCLVRVVE